MGVNLEIPAELITEDAHDIKYNLIEGKIIVGFCGYAGAGKDTLAIPMMERLNFTRIAFGDMLKKDLDKYMRQPVYEDLLKKGQEIKLEDVQFLNPKNRKIKEILRTYIIWFGEEMRHLNGVYHWVNKALENVGDSKKVVITDIRRLNELEIFEQSREYYRRLRNNRDEANVPENPTTNFSYSKRYESFLIHINQRDLTDTDDLTVQTILTAHSQWLFDYTIYIDYKIPNSEDNSYREKHILNHLRELVKKFPQYFV